MAFTKNLLSFYHENGCIEAVGDVPVNRYEAKTPTPPPTRDLLNAHASQPARSASVPPVTNPQGDNLSTSLDKCQTLEELKKTLMNFDGCALKKTARHTVFGDGNPQSGVMLVGEAPGAEEDAQGLPFVGQSGQLLDNIMASIGLDRTRMYISNIIPWRPPGNRPPTTQEIALCLPFIQKHIALVKPKVLLLIGGVAAKALLNTSEGIMKLRGQWLDYTTVDGNVIKAMATFHPAYLLRSPNQKALVWRDMLMVKAYLESQKVLA